jgi:hypothetical protein
MVNAMATSKNLELMGLKVQGDDGHSTTRLKFRSRRVGFWATI